MSYYEEEFFYDMPDTYEEERFMFPFDQFREVGGYKKTGDVGRYEKPWPIILGGAAIGIVAGTAIAAVFRDSIVTLVDGVQKGVGLVGNGTKKFVRSASSAVGASRRRKGSKGRKAPKRHR